MRDLERIVREGVELAYERSAGDGSTSGDVKRDVVRRGRRRRAARTAVAALAIVAFAAAVPVAARDVLQGDAEVAARTVPDLGAELVWETGGPVATDGRSVWFGWGTDESADGELTNLARMDPPTGEVFEGPVAASHPHDLALGESGLWSVSAHGDLPVGGDGHPVRGAIERFDPRTLERTARIDRPNAAPSALALGVDGGREVVWVVDGATSELLEVDGASAEVVEARAVPPGSSSVLADGPYVFVGSSESHEVVRFDVESGEATTFEVPDCANEMTVGAGSLWVVDYCGRRLLRMDPESGDVVASVGMEGAPSAVAFADGLVWVAADRVVRVDPATNEIVGDAVHVPDLFSNGMVEARGSMWVGASGGGGVYRLDEKSPPLVPTPTLSPEPDPAIADLASGMSRVSVPRDPRVLETGAGSVWAGAFEIYRIDPVSGGLLTAVDPGGWVEDLAFDEEAGLLWALVEIAERGTHAVVALDPATEEFVLDPVPVDLTSALSLELTAHDGTAWVLEQGHVLTGIDLGGRTVEIDVAEQLAGRGDTAFHLATTDRAVYVVATDGGVVVVNPRAQGAELVDDLGGYVYGVVADGDVVWAVQQTSEGELVLWSLHADTGRKSRGRILGAARGFPNLAVHGRTVWIAQTGAEAGGLIAYAPAEDVRNEIDVPAGSTVTALAAGPSGAWLNSGREFLYRMAPP